jgi:hypothetical protein
MHPRTRIALVAAALALIAGGAQAGSNTPTTPSGTPAPAPIAVPSSLSLWMPPLWAPSFAAPAAGGLWVSRDPVDGTLGMPSLRELAGMPGRASLVPEETPVRVEIRADGTLIALLDDRWADFAVASLGASGAPAWTCVAGRQGVAQFLARPVIVVAPPTVAREDR